MRVQQNIYNFCKKSMKNENKKEVIFYVGYNLFM